MRFVPAVIVIGILLAGCSITNDDTVKAAIKSCSDHGGAANVGSHNEVTCVFPPRPEAK